MSKNQATPRPWRFSESGNPDFKYCIVAPDGGSVCFVTNWREALSNARLIVQAANCHDELVDACMQAYNHLTGLGDYYRDADPKTIPMLEKVLAKVGGGMIKWPEPKYHNPNCRLGLGTQGCTCQAEGYNAAREACIKAYEQEPKLVGLDYQEVYKILISINKSSLYDVKDFVGHGLKNTDLVMMERSKAICSKFGTRPLPTVEEIESIMTGIMFPGHGVGYRYSVCINTAKAIHELLTKGEK